MKVIGAGLPRTATSTQMIALEMLGFGPCYHMRNVLGDMEGELPKWERVMAGNADWEDTFGDAQSSCDWPSAAFTKELSEHYPDAKVVLTVRDPQGWVKSMRETVWAIYFGDSVMHHVCDARYLIDPSWKRFIDLMIPMIWEGDSPLAGDTFDDDAFAGMFEAYTARIRAEIPAERLLVWDPREGWEPLCSFLEVEVPDEPLPRVNDTAAFKEGIVGGGIAAINDWWDQRDPASGALHGAERQQAPIT